MKYKCIFFSLIISSSLFSQDSFLSDYRLKWKNATEYTLEFARAMPEDHYDYKPTEIEMTYREQLQHVATNMIWICSSYLGGKADHIDPSKSGPSKKEIISMLEKSFLYAMETINRMTEKNLNDRVDFLAGNMTKRRLLFLLTDHVTHHRGQLVVYLRLKNVEPPDYRGW